LYNLAILDRRIKEAEAVKRSEWLKKVRTQAEALYDHGAPAYWVIWGLDIDPTHRQFIEKFLGHLGEKCSILDAACGAGRFDGMLLEAGHSVLGIDQSAGVLARAREHYPQQIFPGLQYEKIGLQDMDFHARFDGIICIDAMEHICPEDWPVILDRFQRALTPGGILYITVDAEKPDEDRRAYERAKALGLPVVYGEVVDELDEAYAQAMAMVPLDLNKLSYERLDHTVYHYHPSLEQVRTWLNLAGFVIEEEADEDEYAHFLAKKSL
jgi:2-polyprenyl-3-methyl-5-hydroxy-6-metoxy-1,4-benzoquinol methylase